MRKIILITFVLIMLSGLMFNHENEIKQTRKSFNVYIKDGSTYVLSNSSSFPKEGYVLNIAESSCTNGGILTQNEITKAINVQLSRSDKCNLYFDLENESTFDKLHSLNNDILLKSGNPDFTKSAPLRDGNNLDTSEVGLYKMEDDYGDSIYFRGNIEYNYVKYGKNSSNNDMFWRIIRINGDGTLRMIYDGTSTHANGEVSNNRVVGTSAYNSGSPADPGYVGYMYGNFTTPSTSYNEAHANINSSTIKTYIDNWYLQNIVNTGYDTNIADTVFCNDRSMRNGDLGYGANETYFGPYVRITSSTLTPSLKCVQKNDAFTKDDTVNGNGNLTYPVGLVTADELIAGGASWTSNHDTYLYKGDWYWSMSPGLFNSSTYAIILNPNDYSNSGYVLSVGGVAPVVNLKKEAVLNLVGTGTMQNPFHLN